MSTAQRFAPAGILFGLFLFILWWFRVYFTGENIASVDLPSHFVLSRGLREQLLHGRLTFYDHTTFTGFPAFRFYGVFPALCAALLSYPLGFFFPDPIVPASHFLLVFGMALFPLSFYFAARPFAVEILGDEARFRSHATVFSLLTGTFAFWFLNHDHQWYGIGAAAPMNIGLFAQLFGWHFFLLYLGLLIRLHGNPTPRAIAGLAVCYGALPLCHTLTFVFATILSGYFFLFYRNMRAPIVLANMLGFCLSGFWFIPALSLLGEFTAFDIYRPKGDFLELLFRYPWHGLFRSLKSWLTGEFSLLDPIHIVQPVLVVMLFAHPRVPRNGVTFGLALFTLACIVIFSSGFTASSLPIGLHYYRFVAYEFLLFTLLTSVVPLVVLRSGIADRIQYLLALCALAAFVVTVNLPHYEREKIAKHTGVKYLKNERKVVEYFKALPSKGRVYIEYLTDYDKYPPLSAHYISSRLYHETGFEAVVSSHLQESMAYRMLVVSARLLGAKTYNVPLLFTDEAELPRAVLVQQLRDFGVTHVICSRKEFCETLEKEIKTPAEKFGLYKIFQLQDAGITEVEPVDKEVIGYIDVKGNLPFHLVQYFFYSKERYYKRFHLFDLSKSDLIPQQLSMLLVNAKPNSSGLEQLRQRAGEVKIGALDFERPYLLNHYEPHYPHNMELDHYKEAEKYLSSSLPFDLIFREPEQTVEPQNFLRFTWDQGGQEFSIQGAIPGQLYRVNYSYFPYWHVKGAKVFRGSGERIYLLAEKDTILGSYSAWRSKASWIGVVLSALSLIAVTLLFRRDFKF